MTSHRVSAEFSSLRRLPGHIVAALTFVLLSILLTLR